jgi:hypothetical protein
MSQIKFTLIVDLPDGMVPVVDYSDETPPEPPYVMAPLPEAPQYDRDEDWCLCHCLTWRGVCGWCAIAGVHRR